MIGINCPTLVVSNKSRTWIEEVFVSLTSPHRPLFLRVDYLFEPCHFEVWCFINPIRIQYLRLDRRTVTKHWMTWSFVIRVKKLNKSSSCRVHYTRVSWTGTHSLSFLTLITKLQSFSAFCNIPQPTILVKNLETLVSISPSPMLIWVSQWSQCFKIRVAQHWGGRRHISGGKTVWSRNLMIFPENSRETVSVSTICDEYCSCTQIMGKGVANGLSIPMNSYPPDLTKKLSLYCRFSTLFLTVIYLTKVTSDNQWNSRLVLIKATHSGGWEEGGRDEVWDRECSLNLQSGLISRSSADIKDFKTQRRDGNQNVA